VFRVARHLLALALLSPSIPAAQQSPPRAAALTRAEARRWRADPRYLAAEMPKRQANLYHSMSRGEFAAAVQRLDARIPSLRREQVILELARLAANAHDSRGEALAIAGDTAAAIREYDAAVRLDPALPGAADRLRVLRGR
jgi:tetratricopeptide (TPR) repeat protein